MDPACVHSRRSPVRGRLSFWQDPVKNKTAALKKQKEISFFCPRPLSGIIMVVLLAIRRHVLLGM